MVDAGEYALDAEAERWAAGEAKRVVELLHMAEAKGIWLLC